MAKPTNAPPTGSFLDRLSTPARVGLGLIFVVIVGVLYFVVFYADVENSIAAAEQKGQAKEKELETAKASREAYQKDLDEKTRREQLAMQQKKVLPDDSETPAFLSSLQGIATIAGVNLTSWSPMDESKEEFFAKVPMKLTLTGKFHQLVKFFHGVGQLDRIINIEDIKIKAAKPSGTTKEATAQDDVMVDAECLATAFRAARPGEQKVEPKKRGGH